MMFVKPISILLSLLFVSTAQIAYAEQTSHCKQYGDEIDASVSILDYFKIIEYNQVIKSKFETNTQYKARINKLFDGISNHGEVVIINISNPANEQSAFYYNPENSSIVIDQNIFDYLQLYSSQKGLGVGENITADYNSFPFTNYPDYSDKFSFFTNLMFFIDDGIPTDIYNQLRSPNNTAEPIYYRTHSQVLAEETMKKSRVSIIVSGKWDFSSYRLNFENGPTKLNNLRGIQSFEANLDCLYVTAPYFSDKTKARIIYTVDLKNSRTGPIISKNAPPNENKTSHKTNLESTSTPANQVDNKFGFVKLRNSKGAYILLVVKNSPAEKAGLKYGDTIVAVNGMSLKGLSNNEINKAIDNISGEASFELGDGRKINIRKAP